MGQNVLIIGETGHGKTYMTKELDPKNTLIISIGGRKPTYERNNIDLRLNKESGNFIREKDPEKVSNILTAVSKHRPDIKNIVIDDAQWLMAFIYLEKAMKMGYDVYKEIAKKTFDVIQTAIWEVRDNVIVYWLWHPEEVTKNGGYKSIKAKTVGNMLDNNMTLESIFDTVLRLVIRKNDNEIIRTLVTQTDGFDTCRSAEGLFDSFEIPASLKLVEERIRKFNNI